MDYICDGVGVFVTRRLQASWTAISLLWRCISSSRNWKESTRLLYCLQTWFRHRYDLLHFQYVVYLFVLFCSHCESEMTVMYTWWVKKVDHWFLCHNFTSYWPTHTNLERFSGHDNACYAAVDRASSSDWYVWWRVGVQDGSAVAPMVSLDTAGMKELDLLSKDIDELKRYTASVVISARLLLLWGLSYKTS